MLGHGPVGGPLAASDGDEIGGADVDDVVAGQGLGVVLVGIGDQRADAAPCGEHIATAHLHIRIQIVLDLVEDKLDLVLGGRWIVGDFAGQVGGAGNRLPLPGQEEDDAAVGSGGIQQTHLIGAIVARQYDMNSGTGAADALHRGVVHLADGVREGTGGINNALGLHGELLAGDMVLDLGSAQHLFASAVVLLQQLLHLHVIAHSGTVTSGSQRHRQTHPGIILLAIIVDDSAAQLVLLEHGEQFEGILLGEVVRAFHIAIAGHQIVGLDAHPVVRNLPPSGDAELSG